DHPFTGDRLVLLRVVIRQSERVELIGAERLQERAALVVVRLGLEDDDLLQVSPDNSKRHTWTSGAGSYVDLDSSRRARGVGFLTPAARLAWRPCNPYVYRLDERPLAISGESAVRAPVDGVRMLSRRVVRAGHRALGPASAAI